MVTRWQSSISSRLLAAIHSENQSQFSAPSMAISLFYYVRSALARSPSHYGWLQTKNEAFDRHGLTAFKLKTKSWNELVFKKRLPRFVIVQQLIPTHLTFAVRDVLVSYLIFLFRLRAWRSFFFLQKTWKRHALRAAAYVTRSAAPSQGAGFSCQLISYDLELIHSLL